MNITFYPYWAAKTLLSFIQVVYIMVMTLLIYGQTGSVLYAALFPFIQMTVRIVAGVTSPWLVNRFSFAKFIIGIAVAKTFILTGIGISLAYLTVHIPVLLVIITVLSFLEGWESPILDSLPPRLAQGEELVKANNLLTFSNQTATMVGYAITGFVVFHWGASQTFWAAVAMSWANLVLMIAIALLSSEIVGQADNTHVKRVMLRKGWFLLRNKRTLRLLTYVDVLKALAGSIWVGAITLAFVQESLGQGVHWWGLIHSSYAAGAILGIFLTRSLTLLGQRHLISSMAVSSLLFTLSTLAFGLNSLPWLALVLSIFIGSAGQIREIELQNAFQNTVPTASLSDVYAARSMLLTASMSSSALFFGFVADQFGVRQVYFIGGALLVISALCMFGLNQVRQQSSSDEGTGVSWIK
ncbi:MFS transporter [Paenibacillus xylanilyticus]|uniref:MFS transporter n=1 Tax=Paenibacillus xylanilyticus TaxID=248903 RepID=UPI0039A2D886